MTTVTIRRPSPSTTRVLTAAGGGLVALALTIGLGSWQDRGHSSTTQPAAVSSQAHALPSQGQDTGAAPTIAIVATSEDAGHLWEAINIAPDGPLGSVAEVLVLDPAAGPLALQVITEMDSIRSGFGLPPITIIDRRGT